MSRKDYELIAEALIDSRPDQDNVEAWSQWKFSVIRMAVALQSTNDRFNRSKFETYCEKK